MPVGGANMFWLDETISPPLWRPVSSAHPIPFREDTVDASYETVAAGQTDQAMGATGATGDYLKAILIIPATTSPGVVSIKDGGGSAITIFTGGATSVADLKPFSVPLGLTSLAGAWKVTTGANVSAIGTGQFT